MSTSIPFSYDVLVLGGGTAGMTAAKLVARGGRSVALIEAERTGGDCLFTGCVPSKSLIATARLLHAIRGAAAHGIDVGTPALDLRRAMARKDANIDKIGEVDSPTVLEKAGVNVIKGWARLTSAHGVEVDGRSIHGAQIVIATGSRPAIPSIPGLDEVGYLTNVELMEARTVPARLGVLGAGATGLELGQAFARFGSMVTVVDHGERVLDAADGDVSALLRRALEAEGIRFHLRTTVERAERIGTTTRLTLQPADGQPFALDVDALLVATGRSPNVEDLGLDAAGIVTVRQGVRVDRRLRTNTPNIWACGDVTGPPYFTHAAEDQARTVANNILGDRASWSDRALPWVVFTDPEVAAVGLSEEAARESHGDSVEVLRLPYTRIDRAITDGEPTGLIKVILAPGWTRGLAGGEIVGAHIAGAQAGELIEQFGFAMRWRLPAGLLARAVQAYPTYGLGVRQAVGSHWYRSTPSDAFSPLTRLRRRLGG